jgi:hypothetical protein
MQKQKSKTRSLKRQSKDIENVSKGKGFHGGCADGGEM